MPVIILEATIIPIQRLFSRITNKTKSRLVLFYNATSSLSTGGALIAICIKTDAWGDRIASIGFFNISNSTYNAIYGLGVAASVLGNVN